MFQQDRQYLTLMLLTGLVGAVSVAANIGPAFGGNGPALGRTALGVLGVAAAAMMWVRPRTGWLIGLIWAVIQIPVFAWSTDGSPTTQFLSFPLSMTSQTSINGQISSYSQLGLNLVGVILAAWLNARRGLFDPRYVGREAEQPLTTPA